MSQLTRSLFCLFLTLLFVGCATNSNSVKSNPAGVIEFTAPLSLQEATDRIMIKARRCNALFKTPNGGETHFSNLAILSPNKIVEIDFFNNTNILPFHYVLVEIKAQSEGVNVSVFYKFSPWKEGAERVQGWVNGTTQQCLWRNTESG